MKKITKSKTTKNQFTNMPNYSTESLGQLQNKICKLVRDYKKSCLSDVSVADDLDDAAGEVESAFDGLEADIEGMAFEDALVEEETELEDYECIEHLNANGYAVIKIDNLADQQKLEQFITTELYPNYADRDKYSF